MNLATVFAVTATREPPSALVLPFFVLLLCIALLPVFLKHHWDRHYHRISVGLGAVSVLYYVFPLGAGREMLKVAQDYGSFMVVIGSVFVIAGGIHLQAKGAARPSANLLFLLFGAALGTAIGTMGAAMVLIRPWIGMNKHRFTGCHLAFFVFVVGNIGGALTPIGPPLLLGYLKGIPFWWGAARCWPGFLVTLGSVLAVFYVVDRLNYCGAAPKIPTEQAVEKKWRLYGMGNVAVLAAAVWAMVALPAGLREAVLIAAAAASYLGTPERVHAMNEFSFRPIEEVAWVFLGIFATMKPVLDYVTGHAADLGVRSDAQFYWLSGTLSAVLDNAPTYLTFLAAAFGLEHLDLNDPAQVRTFVRFHDHYLVALSLGSTCFGALTYIGNGPNLVIKSIAEHSKVHTPSFFAYFAKYSAPALLPVFGLVAWFFFRR